MNHGVKILIERMQSNPEDFKAGGRFYDYISALEQLAEDGPYDGSSLYFLPAADREALRDAWREYMAQDFTSRVMQTLVEDPEEAKLRNMLRKQTKSMGMQNIASPQQLQNEYARQMALNQAQNSVLGIGNQITGFPTQNKPPF